MSVVIETTLGDITVDLFLLERPRACLNFLKLCKIKYYNFNLFHTISRGFIAQTGDPTGTRTGGESIFAVIDGPTKKYFEAENEPRIKHTRPGLISFVGGENNMIASQFFLTLGEDLTYLDEKHCVFGEIVEGFEILETINEVICDNDDRPFQDVRITHTVVLDDPYPDPKGFRLPSRSPSPSVERLAGGRIAPDEEIDEMSGKSAKEISEMQAEREAKARATILEMVGDIPDADMAPPENVLFVCKLNPITQDDDLEILFSRFGKIKSCEVIRDRKTGDSLQYAFIEFEDQKSCEDAYFKMDNVLVDDRRLHVDFSQSVSKVKWLGKGRGVINYDDKGNKKKADISNNIGKGEYKIKNGSGYKNRQQSKSPKRKQLSSSPEKSRRSKSPQLIRRPSRSPKRRRLSRTPIKKSESPARRTKYNRSPDHSSRRNNRKFSPRRMPDSPKRSRSNLRRNMQRYSPERKSGFSRRRSRSPWMRDRSGYNRRNILNSRRRSRSPIWKGRSSTRKSRSPTKRSDSSGERSRPTREPDRSAENRSPKDKQSKLSTKSGIPKTGRSKSPIGRSRSPKEQSELQRKEGKLFLKRQGQNVRSLKELSESPKRTRIASTSKNLQNTEGRYESKGDKKSILESTNESSRDKRPIKERLTSENNFLIEKTRKKGRKANDKVKDIKKTSSSKKKKFKKHSSSDESETESEEERKKSKKKKSKKKVESSTESSSSEESSSSSSDEEVVKKASKRNKKKRDKKRKNKKAKKRGSSSSDSSSDSDSESSSSSSSSSSESDKRKKKRSKKKRTKTSSDSE